jgi:predicted nucleic acid-binding protein
LIAYFDTSAILPIIVEEPSSLAASRLWDEADRVVSSRLVYAEGRAALAMARRIERVDRGQLRSAVEDFEALHEQLDIVEVTETLVRDAGALAEQFALRGYYAVHLASAQLVRDPDMVLAAGDKNLLKAARALRIATANLETQS